MKRKITLFLLALVSLFALAVNVSATHPVPDLSRNGSLTLVMEFDGVKLNNGALNIYKVGDIAENDGNYSFVPVATLQGQDFKFDDLNNELAKQVLTLVKEKTLKYESAPIEDGAVAFTDVPVGLYVVWQNSEDATKGLLPIEPFLISVPNLYNDEYVLDVVAKPKNAPETEPPTTTTPPPPTPPDLPQTGQLNWPVPVMALMGTVLFIVGCILCASRKRMAHEK